MALTDNLIAFWGLEEASGTRNDAHGSNHLIDNNTVGSATGRVGTCANFDRFTDEHLSIVDNAALSTGDIDFTICAWVKLDTKTGSEVIVAKDDFGTSNREYLLFWDSSTDRFYFRVSPDGGSGSLGTVIANSFGAPASGSWNFVRAWHDASANTINIQVNDGTIDSVSHTTGVFNSAAAFTVGCHLNSGSTTNHFDGMLDQIGFWKRVLTGAESTKLYNGGGGLAYAALNQVAILDGLISFWELGEASGTRNDAHGINDLDDFNTVTSATGKVGDAALWTAANSERLAIAGASLSLNPSTAATWCFWYNATSGPGDLASFWTKWDHGISSTWLFQPDNLFIAASAGDTGSNRNLVPAGTFEAGEWNFYIIEFDGSQTGNLNRLKLFKNDTAVTLTSTGTIPATLVTSTAEMQLGSCTTLGRFHNGMLDQAGFWSRVLTSAEKTGLYNSGAGLSYSALSSWEPGGGVTVPSFRRLIVGM
jgi:hypothetical protein